MYQAEKTDRRGRQQMDSHLRMLYIVYTNAVCRVKAYMQKLIVCNGAVEKSVITNHFEIEKPLRIVWSQIKYQ